MSISSVESRSLLVVGGLGGGLSWEDLWVMVFAINSVGTNLGD